MRKNHILTRSALAAVAAAVAQAVAAQSGTGTGFVEKLGLDMDVRSGGRILQDELRASRVILQDLAAPVSGGSTVPQVQRRGGNVQASSPALDNIQIFPGFRPFVRATQSETSMAAAGRNVVATFNNSGGIHVSPNPSGPGLIVDQVLLSGFASSSDGGQTWQSGYMPTTGDGPGASTYGDPSVAVDRHGVFYFAGLGADGSGASTVQVNRSTDGGRTWSDAVVVQQDDASDKEWLAVGPDPVSRNRDNVYVTWTSFQDEACELRFGRSLDGGVSWSSKTIYVPTANVNPTFPQNCLQFSNPVVDPHTGVLYVPFLHFSNADQDFIQMLVSSDAGETFHFATFNVPGAPDPTLLPVTQPGELTQCGGANLRLTIHDAQNAGPGAFGLPRYVNASRMILQPALAALDGTLHLAWNNSRSPFFGSPAGSDVLYVRSTDGGATWSAPMRVNPANADHQHVLPAIAVDNPQSVHVTYYTQHANGTIDLDMANSHDGGLTFPDERTLRVTSTSFNLPPTNIPLSNAPAYAATNYDRQIQVCYALGEYQSVTTANGAVWAAWGDARNLITEPAVASDPLAGQTHGEQDVFVQKMKAQ